MIIMRNKLNQKSHPLNNIINEVNISIHEKMGKDFTVEDVILEFINNIKNKLYNNERVQIKGFMTLFVKPYKKKYNKLCNKMLPDRWLPTVTFSQKFVDYIKSRFKNNEQQ
jgi:nucleoid DNA-binding protein